MDARRMVRHWAVWACHLAVCLALVAPTGAWAEAAAPNDDADRARLLDVEVEGASRYAQSTLDAYLSSVNNRLNETMKRLTVVGALLAPLTVITGLYGMNFDHMPELHWRFGYLWAVGLMIAVSGGLITWFKKKQWI